MTEANALHIAKDIAEGECTLTIHHGAHPREDRAVRITGTWRDDAEIIGQRIAVAIKGTLRSDAGFVAVWF